jgi:hypothetical protein
VKFNIFFDKSVYIITLFCICLTLGLPILFLLTFSDFLFFFITLFITVIPLAISASFAPRYYLIKDDGIIIKKVIGKIIIHKKEVESITMIKSEMLNGVIRTFASGGFFGYYGLFYSNSMKKITMYAGSISKNLVLIKLKTGKSYIITPKEPEIFMNAIPAHF